MIDVFISTGITWFKRSGGYIAFTLTVCWYNNSLSKNFGNIFLSFYCVEWIFIWYMYVALTWL